MPELSTAPGSISPPQMRAINTLLSTRGEDRDGFKALIGVDSLKELSRARASVIIDSLGGGELPNPPGRAPRVRRPVQAGVTRMITTDQVEQIARLGWRYFNDTRAVAAWLSKNFKVPFFEPHSPDDVLAMVRRLGTAQRAGHVIRTLKIMLQRRRP